MTENQTVDPGTINPDEVVDVGDINTIPDDSAPPEKVQALKKGVQTLSAQKKHWRDEAIDPVTGKKWKEIAAQRTIITPQKPPEPTGSDPEMGKRVASLEQVEEKRQFGHEHNLSPEETDRVFIFAQGAGKKPAEVLKDPFIESGLKSMRSANRSSSATPRPSNRNPIVGDKKFADLSDAERRDNWGKVTGRDR